MQKFIIIIHNSRILPDPEGDNQEVDQDANPVPQVEPAI